MQKFSTSPKALFNGFWVNRHLIKSLTQREIQGRYKGSFVGVFWSLLIPIFMLIVYTFVFSVVFKARWSSGNESTTEYALLLFAGLMVFNLLSDCLSKAPTLILNNVNFVKKVLFPLEILPWVNFFTSLFHFCISLLVWLMAYMLLIGPPNWTIFWTPAVALPLSLFIMGLSWTLSALGVFVRDATQFIGVTLTILMFVSPIFYPITALPENFRFYLKINPLSPIIEMMRDTLYFAKFPDFTTWVTLMVGSFMIAWGGFAFFQKTRKGFSDVL